MLKSSICTSIGGRAYQQDAGAVICDTDGFVIGTGIFDGAGGLTRGELASQYARESVLEEFGKHALGHLHPGIPALLASVAASAQKRVSKLSADPDSGEAATTMLILIVVENVVFVAWAGDSKAWLWSGGVSTPLTRSHSLPDDLFRAGEIASHDVARHRDNNIITRALSTGQGDIDRDGLGWWRPDITAYPAQPGDMLITASDGLEAVLEDHELDAILGKAPFDCDDPAAMARGLVDEALRLKTPDNVTVGVTRVMDPYLEAAELVAGPTQLATIYDNNLLRKEHL